MAVAFDAASESHTGTTGSQSQASFSWTHTPVGTPRGVLVFVLGFEASADIVSGVTYGGTALTAVPGAIAQAATAEPCLVKAYFLGSGVPTGAQSVVVSRTNNANDLYAVSISVTAGGNTDCAGPQTQNTIGTLDQVSVNDGSPGTNSLRFAALVSGLGTLPPAGGNSTLLHSLDFGANGGLVVRETTAGQGSRPVGFFSVSSDDRAAVYLAVREAGNARSGSAAISGGGPLVASVRKTGLGITALPGGGVLTASVRKGARGVVALPGGGAVTATGSVILAKSGSASVSGGGLLAASVRKNGRGLTGVPGGGAVLSTGRKIGNGAIGLPGGGALVASIRKGARGLAAWAGGGLITATGAKRAVGATAFSGGGSIQATGTGAAGATGSASITSGGAVLAMGRKGGRSTATVSGGGLFAAIGIAVAGIPAKLPRRFGTQPWRIASGYTSDGEFQEAAPTYREFGVQPYRIEHG